MNQGRRYFEYFLVVLLFSALSLVVLTNALPTFNEPGRDGGFFMYAGDQIAQGRQLYLDVWDSKGPLIFYINALGISMGDWLGKDTRWGVWFLEFLFMLASALIGYSVLKRSWGIFPAALGGALGLMSAKQLLGTGNFTEEYSLLFTWISIFALYQSAIYPERKRYPLLMGAMLITSFLIRANNIGTSAALLLIWLIKEWRCNGFKKTVNKALFVIGGMLLVLMPVLVYFAAIGTLDDMTSASITYNFSYSFDARPEANNFNIFKSSLKPAFTLLRIWIIFPTIGFILAIVHGARKLKEKRITVLEIALIIVWPVEILASSISGRGYSHYFISWLPILTLLSGYFFWNVDQFALSHNFSEIVNKRKPHLGFGIAILITLYIFSGSFNQYLETINLFVFNKNQEIEYTPKIANYISANTDQDDFVLVWGGQAGINLMSDRNSSTAYIYYPLYTNSPLGITLQEKFYDDLVKNKPVLIVDAYIDAPDVLPSLDPKVRSEQIILYPLANNTQQSLDYITANYEQINQIDGYTVYRLKSENTVP